MFATYVAQRSHFGRTMALLVSCSIIASVSGEVPLVARSLETHRGLFDTQPFHDVEFDASQPRLIPFKLIANWIVLSVKINGRECRMLLDSGAPNVISTSAAANLGLNAKGKYAGWGAGKREVIGGETTVARLRIGNVVLHDQTFHVIDLPYAFSHGFSPSIEGVIGYELLRRLVVRIDFQRTTIRFLDPPTFHYHGKGVAVPFYFQEQVPVVAGTVDGLQGAFQIDTGSEGSLSLTSPFVTANDLIKKYSAHIHGFAGEGVGGRENAYFVRARVLDIGGVDITSVVTELLGDTGGIGAAQDIAGFIGTGVLKHFNLTFDYSSEHYLFREESKLQSAGRVQSSRPGAANHARGVEGGQRV